MADLKVYSQLNSTIEVTPSSVSADGVSKINVVVSLIDEEGVPLEDITSVVITASSDISGLGVETVGAEGGEYTFSLTSNAPIETDISFTAEEVAFEGTTKSVSFTEVKPTTVTYYTHSKEPVVLQLDAESGNPIYPKDGSVTYPLYVSSDAEGDAIYPSWWGENSEAGAFEPVYKDRDDVGVVISYSGNGNVTADGLKLPLKADDKVVVGEWLTVDGLGDIIIPVLPESMVDADGVEVRLVKWQLKTDLELDIESNAFDTQSDNLSITYPDTYIYSDGSTKGLLTVTVKGITSGLPLPSLTGMTIISGTEKPLLGTYTYKGEGENGEYLFEVTTSSVGTDVIKISNENSIGGTTEEVVFTQRSLSWGTLYAHGKSKGTEVTIVSGGVVTLSNDEIVLPLMVDGDIALNTIVPLDESGNFIAPVVEDVYVDATDLVVKPKQWRHINDPKSFGTLYDGKGDEAIVEYNAGGDYVENEWLVYPLLNESDEVTFPKKVSTDKNGVFIQPAEGLLETTTQNALGDKVSYKVWYAPVTYIDESGEYVEIERTDDGELIFPREGVTYPIHLPDDPGRVYPDWWGENSVDGEYGPVYKDSDPKGIVITHTSTGVVTAVGLKLPLSSDGVIIIDSQLPLDNLGDIINPVLPASMTDADGVEVRLAAWTSKSDLELDIESNTFDKSTAAMEITYPDTHIYSDGSTKGLVSVKVTGVTSGLPIPSLTGMKIISGNDQPLMGTYTYTGEGVDGEYLFDVVSSSVGTDVIKISNVNSTGDVTGDVVFTQRSVSWGTLYAHGKSTGTEVTISSGGIVSLSNDDVALPLSVDGDAVLDTTIPVDDTGNFTTPELLSSYVDATGLVVKPSTWTVTAFEPTTYGTLYNGEGESEIVKSDATGMFVVSGWLTYPLKDVDGEITFPTKRTQDRNGVALEIDVASLLPKTTQTNDGLTVKTTKWFSDVDYIDALGHVVSVSRDNEGELILPRDETYNYPIRLTEDGDLVYPRWWGENNVAGVFDNLYGPEEDASIVSYTENGVVTSTALLTLPLKSGDVVIIPEQLDIDRYGDLIVPTIEGDLTDANGKIFKLVPWTDKTDLELDQESEAFDVALSKFSKEAISLTADGVLVEHAFKITVVGELSKEPLTGLKTLVVVAVDGGELLNGYEVIEIGEGVYGVSVTPESVSTQDLTFKTKGVEATLNNNNIKVTVLTMNIPGSLGTIYGAGGESLELTYDSEGVMAAADWFAYPLKDSDGEVIVTNPLVKGEEDALIIPTVNAVMFDASDIEVRTTVWYGSAMFKDAKSAVYKVDLMEDGGPTFPTDETFFPPLIGVDNKPHYPADFGNRETFWTVDREPIIIDLDENMKPILEGVDVQFPIVDINGVEYVGNNRITYYDRFGEEIVFVVNVDGETVFPKDGTVAYPVYDSESNMVFPEWWGELNEAGTLGTYYTEDNTAYDISYDVDGNVSILLDGKSQGKVSLPLSNADKVVVLKDNLAVDALGNNVVPSLPDMVVDANGVSLSNALWEVKATFKDALGVSFEVVIDVTGQPTFPKDFFPPLISSDNEVFYPADFGDKETYWDANGAPHVLTLDVEGVAIIPEENTFAFPLRNFDRTVSIEDPSTPVDPEVPVDPELPVDPVDPVEPEVPSEGVDITKMNHACQIYIDSKSAIEKPVEADDCVSMRVKKFLGKVFK